MKIYPTFIDWWKINKNRFSGIFFDIDGTLINAGKALPGAKTIISELEKENFPYLLLTNDGNHSVEEKSGFLKRAGLSIHTKHFISCGMALEIFVEKNNCRGKKFFVMGDLGKPCYAELAGLKVEREPKKINECEGIIIGEGIYDWQKAFFAAVNFLIKKPDTPMLVPNPDSYWPNGSEGQIGIGAGGKARFLCTLLREYGIRKKPIYFGKPYNMIFNFAIRKMKELYPDAAKFHKHQIIMLGDSIKSDIKGAKKSGITSALLLTGITTKKHLSQEKKYIPDLVFAKIANS